jgi:hypothetical protein
MSTAAVRIEPVRITPDVEPFRGGRFSLQLDDPDDIDELKGDEILLTCVKESGDGPDVPFCFRMTTGAARLLIGQLAAACDAREAAGTAPEVAEASAALTR